MEDVDEPMAFFPHVMDMSGNRQDRDHAFHSFRHEESTSEAAKPILTATPLMEYRASTLSSLSSALHVHTNNICGCQQSILSKLLELSRAKYGTPTPFDKSLSDNKTIIALCNSVLSCSVAQHGEDIVLVLTLIALISHLITVYDILFRTFTQSRNCTSSASSTFSSNRSAEGSGFVTPNTPTSSRDAMLFPRDLQAFSSVRLSLGTYQLDQKDEQILQVNLVKIELGKIGALIDGFGRRFVKGDEEWDGGGGDGRRLETRALGELLGYLHGRLRSHHEALRSWSSGL
ncbi:hypothetical protein MMC30_009336 [Trapelia coarctata]|nr:hypothetical protein [Trapelia coarctata]